MRRNEPPAASVKRNAMRWKSLAKSFSCLPSRNETAAGTLAVERRKPRAHVGKPDTRARGGGKAAAVIRHAQGEGAARLFGLDADCAAFGEGADAVLDGILDQRREHHRRHAGTQQ